MATPQPVPQVVKPSNQQNPASSKSSVPVNWKPTGDVLKAIMGNLSTTQMGLGRGLTAQGQRQVDAIKQLSAATMAKNAQTMANVNVYGSAMGGYTKDATTRARGEQQAGKSVGKAAGAGVSTLQFGNVGAQSVLGQGVAEMRQAAKYEGNLAQATVAAEQTKVQIENQMMLDRYAAEQAIRAQFSSSGGLAKAEEGIQATLGKITQNSSTMAALAPQLRVLTAEYQLSPQEQQQLYSMVQAYYAKTPGALAKVGWTPAPASAAGPTTTTTPTTWQGAAAMSPPPNVSPAAAVASGNYAKDPKTGAVTRIQPTLDDKTWLQKMVIMPLLLNGVVYDGSTNKQGQLVGTQMAPSALGGWLTSYLNAKGLPKQLVTSTVTYVLDTVQSVGAWQQAQGPVPPIGQPAGRGAPGNPAPWLQSFGQDWLPTMAH